MGVGFQWKKNYNKSLYGPSLSMSNAPVCQCLRSGTTEWNYIQSFSLTSSHKCFCIDCKSKAKHTVKIASTLPLLVADRSANTEATKMSELRHNTHTRGKGKPAREKIKHERFWSKRMRSDSGWSKHKTLVYYCCCCCCFKSIEDIYHSLNPKVKHHLCMHFTCAAIKIQWIWYTKSSVGSKKKHKKRHWMKMSPCWDKSRIAKATISTKWSKQNWMKQHGKKEDSAKTIATQDCAPCVTHLWMRQELNGQMGWYLTIWFH